MADLAIEASFGTLPLPPARGPCSAAVIERLRRSRPEIEEREADSLVGVAPVLDDADSQLTLTLLYELHLRGISDVDDDLQWAPDLLRIRSLLEHALWSEVTATLDAGTTQTPAPRDVAAHTVDELWRLTADDDGPGLSQHIRDAASLPELQEVLIHRSPYQLREADVHTLGIPRLAGRPKAALIEVQADEYGGGQLSRMHSVLFAETMLAAGLSAGYMHYLRRVPAVTLASLNVLSYFGLHRCRVGELIGHLAAIEMTSSAPSKRYSAGLARLGFDAGARKFYDEHIEADAVHEQIVARDLVAAWVGDSVSRSRHVLDGARAFLLLEQRVSDHVMSSWAAGRSSLLPESH